MGALQRKQDPVLSKSVAAASIKRRGGGGGGGSKWTRTALGTSDTEETGQSRAVE